MTRSFSTLVALLALLSFSTYVEVTSAQEPNSASAKQKEEPQYIYEVRGASAKDPNGDRPWSKYFDTESDAQDRLKEIQYDY